jgi:ABC-2 type transport system permease protein
VSSPGVATVYRWELRKLRSQKRTYMGFAIAIAIPLIFVIALALQNGQPEGILFGRYVRQSGFAIPLVVLIFGSIWLFPLVTSLVAGDIFASEDHNGTLKTILTRSLDRGQIFAGKVLAAISYAAFALVLMGIVAILAGGLESGFNSLTTLSGTKVGPAKALELVTASLGVYLLPMLAIASIGLLLSTITRNSAAAVVGALMIALVLQIGSIIPGLEEIRPYLLPRQFDAWQGLLREPTDWAPIVRAAWVCAAYAVPSLFAAYVVFLRRDVAGG